MGRTLALCVASALVLGLSAPRAEASRYVPDQIKLPSAHLKGLDLTGAAQLLLESLQREPAQAAPEVPLPPVRKLLRKSKKEKGQLGPALDSRSSR